MAAGSGWTTPVVPYQFEPESEPEEEEEAVEQRHEGENVQCENDVVSSASDEPWDSPAKFSASGEERTSDASRQSGNSPGRRTATEELVQDDEAEDVELGTSLSVGDGRFLVDLGSSAEFVVDEESLLQQLRSCRKCGRQSKVRKRADGLKLVLTQVCFFCAHRYTWTNLSARDDDKDDEDDSDF